LKVVLVIAAAALVALSACGKRTSTADAVRFNDGLVAASNRVTKSARAFGEVLEPAVAGGIEAVAKAKRELENIEEALQRAQADVRLLTVPESASAKAFLAEHQKLLDSMDQGAYQGIQQAQQAFAKEHGFKLK
jgi:hypothetical protein